MLAVLRRLNCALACFRSISNLGEKDEIWDAPSYLEHVLNARARVRLHHALYPDERLHLRVQPVAHELELAIRRNETNGTVVLEPRQSHALVELDVLHLDSLPPRGASRRLEHGLVVQSQPQFGHPAQITLHLDGAQDLRPQDVSVRRDEQVERFDHIQEHLVLAVADAFASPRDSVCDGNGRACLYLELV